MELPSGLTTEKRSDGRLNVVQTTDIGTKDVALVTEGPEVTPSDVEALRVGDREHSDARQFANHFISKAQANKAEYEAGMDKDYFDGVEEVMRLGAWKTTNKFGWSRKYADNFPSDWR